MKKNLAPIGFALFVLLSFVFALHAPAKQPRAAEALALDPQLGRALVEARANLEASRALGAGSPRTLIRTTELELALRGCADFARDPEEHVRLLLVSRLVRDLARAVMRGEGAKRLGEERLTEEDFRFLLGAVEARLARAASREPATRPSSYDAGRLRQFRGLTFEDAIRSLFD